MENRKHVTIFIFIPAFVAGFFICAQDVNAYYADTHSYLTLEVVRFYNQHYADKFPEALINFLVDGARREDDIPRSMNHFYDPVYNRGLTYDAKIDPVNIPGTWEKSKDWAQDSANQNQLAYKVAPTVASILTAVETRKLSLISTESDFTWQRAVDYYARGEWEKAMFALGHIIHLIEDASVPDHTRNDPHATDSSYENWTARFTPSTPDQNLSARLEKASPLSLSNLNEYFDGIATYSNNNFYSDDTIGIQSGYSQPTPEYFAPCDNFICGIVIDDLGEHRILLKERPRILDTVGMLSNSVSLISDKEGGDLIMLDYWSRLSTKAVQYAAGVLSLFFKEAKAAAQKPQPIHDSFIATAINTISNAAEAVSETTRSVAATIILNWIRNSASTAEVINQLQNADVSSLNSVASPDVNTQSGQELSNETPQKADSQNSGDLNNQTVNTPNIPPPQTDSVMSDAEKQAKLAEIAKQIQEISLQVQALQAAAQQNESNKNQNQTDKLDNQPVKLTNQATTTASSTPQSQNVQNTYSVSRSGGSGGGGGSSSSGGGGGGGSAASQPKVYPKLLITEIQLASASSTHDRFVEVYNPNNETVNLTDWYLQRKTSGGTSFSTFAPKSLLAGKTIAPHGYFLITHPSSTFAADIFTTYALTAGNTLVIKDPNGDIRDKVGWGAASDCEGSCAPEPADGTSIQRIYAAGVFQDTDQNSLDFAVLACPSPKSSNVCGITQTSESTSTATSTSTSTSTETSVATSTSTSTATSTDEVATSSESNVSSTLPHIANATAVFATSSMEISLTWSDVSNASSATSTVYYLVKDASSSALLASTTATSTRIGITEVGRAYHFSVQAFADDTAISESTFMSVEIPSLFTDLRLYQDPRVTNSLQYVLDAYYDHYPLVPGDSGMWETAMFYLNADPPSDANPPSEASAPFALTLVYPTCSAWGLLPSPNRSLILPFGPYGCEAVGGGVGVTAFPGATEDKHFIVQVRKSDGSGFSPGDYITAAFYEYDSGGWRPGGFYKTAVDLKRWYFSTTTPTSTPPNPPSDISFGAFDDLHSRITINWPSVTDPDTLDGLLHYEVNSASSSDLATSSWRAVSSGLLQAEVPAFFGGTYVGVRAIDDFGNASTPMIKMWNDFPVGYRPLPHQSDNSVIVGGSLSGGQKIFASSSLNIDAVEMVIGPYGWRGGSSGSYLEIARDAGGIPGEIIATSSNVGHEWWRYGYDTGDIRVADRYVFPSPVQIEGGSYFWLLHRDERDDGYMQTAVYGSAADSYPDGYWLNGSQDSGKDAYFYLRERY